MQWLALGLEEKNHRAAMAAHQTYIKWLKQKSPVSLFHHSVCGWAVLFRLASLYQTLKRVNLSIAYPVQQTSCYFETVSDLLRCHSPSNNCFGNAYVKVALAVGVPFTTIKKPYLFQRIPKYKPVERWPAELYQVNRLNSQGDQP